VKPSLRSKAEQIAAGVEEGRLRAIPGLTEALDAHDATTAQIRELPYVESEIAKRIEAAEAELHQKIAEAVSAATRDAQRPLDEEERAVRASSGNGDDHDAATVSRGHVFATQIGATSDPEQVIDIYEDAVFTGKPDLIRIAGEAARTRLRELAARDKGKPTSPALTACLSFEQRFSTWQRANPTPRARVALLARQRHHAAVAIEESARFALQLYGVRAKAAGGPPLKPVPSTPPSRITVGPAFLDPHARR
jgi:hypothetical protein